MSLRIALFGQAPFGRDALARILESGHEVVGVYAPPEGRRPDPLAEEAGTRGLPLFRHPRFRRKGAAIPELVKEHAELGAGFPPQPAGHEPHQLPAVFTQGGLRRPRAEMLQDGPRFPAQEA